MGMDVYGQSGAYFRNNVWWWRPLADYVNEVAPDIAGRCHAWHSNDGGGLSEADALKLAERLQIELDSGRTASYETIYRSEQEKLPNEPCEICAGTGTRKPVKVVDDDDWFTGECGAGDPKTDGIPCNACNATGYVRAWDSHYPFSADNVREFVDFLRKCEGFEIR
jgi:hypothetical protein